MKNIVKVIIVCLLFSCQSLAQISNSSPETVEKEKLIKKIFPLIHLIENNKEILNEKCFNISDDKFKSLRDSLKVNHFANFETDYISNSFKFTNSEIESYIDEVKSCENLLNLIDTISNKQKYVLETDIDSKKFLEEALRNELEGINEIIDRYALGKSFKYENIDSALYNVQSKYYNKLIDLYSSYLLSDAESQSYFYQPSLYFALSLLEINKRDESIRFEPMELGENKKAVETVKKISWSEYPYSVILIPGSGLEKDEVGLSPIGKLRCELGANNYIDKKAPFIIVSGGFVHPFQTPYCEAIEMKRELMNNYKIPESAIIIEPHARHTTTNFRNAARLMFYYNIPLDKKALCTTTKHQSYYITDRVFDKRCINELGYLPYKIIERLNINDIEFYPQIKSLYIENNDPLDP